MVRDFWWSISFAILDCLLALSWRGEAVAWMCLLGAILTAAAAAGFYLMMQE